MVNCLKNLAPSGAGYNGLLALNNMDILKQFELNSYFRKHFEVLRNIPVNRPEMNLTSFLPTFFIFGFSNVDRKALFTCYDQHYNRLFNFCYVCVINVA